MRSTFCHLLFRLLHGLTVLLLTTVALSAAASTDHIQQKAWLEDANGQLSWPEVQQKDAQPYTGMLSKG